MFIRKPRVLNRISKSGYTRMQNNIPFAFVQKTQYKLTYLAGFANKLIK